MKRTRFGFDEWRRVLPTLRSDDTLAGPAVPADVPDVVELLSAPDVARRIVALAQVRQPAPAWDASGWESTLPAEVRGTGACLGMARRVGSLTFEAVGTPDLEARVPLQCGRANGARRKFGAVQEEVLRRSALLRRGEYFDQALWLVLGEVWAGSRFPADPRVH